MTAPADNSFGTVNVPSQYQNDIITASLRWNIPTEVLAAQLFQESSFNPNARSSAGAQGIAQFLPETARSIGIDPWNTHQSIDGMAQLDATYLKQFGSIDKALAAYNAGPGAVAKAGGVPDFAETKDYVSKILGMAGIAGVSAAPASDLLDPFANVTTFVGRLQDPNFWRRFGVASLGMSVVGVGIYFMLEKDGYKVVRKLENVP